MKMVGRIMERKNMQEFSFFYKKGSAGYVRGEQIANELKGKHNPKEGYMDDICIYVKHYPTGEIPKGTYIDVDDAPDVMDWIKKHPKVGVIVNSQTARDFIAEFLGRDDLHVIPHAHCNWKCEVRPTRPVKKVGIIGSKTSFQYPIEDFKAKLAKIGLELVYEPDYWATYGNNRQKVCDFYKGIDIQVVWRPKQFSMFLKNPNKLYNAGSFGIPTVAYPEFNFVKEWLGYFLPARNMEEMIMWLEKLKNDPEFYRIRAEQALLRAGSTEIENILDLYEQL